MGRVYVEERKKETGLNGIHQEIYTVSFLKNTSLTTHWYSSFGWAREDFCFDIF